MQDTWHIISGKYPPQTGGVSDYTVALSEALAERGCSVHLWVRGFETDSECINPNLTVHRCVGDFGRASLKSLGRQLANFSGPRKILVQYVPHAFGFKAMNMAFATWVRARVREHGDDVRIMFHEVAYPWVWWPLHHNLIAFANRWMARIIGKSASKIYVSTDSWNSLLKALGCDGSRITLLPIPSNVPRVVENQSSQSLRYSILQGRTSMKLVGHFGTYGRWVANMLSPMIIELMRSRFDAHFHLIGEGSDDFRIRILRDYPDWTNRISSTGRKELSEIAKHIACCDLMLQPYPDGVNTRRGSLMACLHNGKAVVATHGRNTDSLWLDNEIVRLAESSPVSCVTQLTKLLNEDVERKSLGIRAQKYYDANFCLEKTTEQIMSVEVIARMLPNERQVDVLEGENGREVSGAEST